MKKKLLTTHGCKEVKIGENIQTNVNITVTEDNIKDLIKLGLICKEGECSPIKTNLNLKYYIYLISQRIGTDYNKTTELLDLLAKLYPIIVFNLLVREIAIEIDKKYSDHIKDSKEIYVISSTSGKIAKLNKKSIRTYRNFAAFRSIEDAKLACGILKPILKKLFKK